MNWFRRLYNRFAGLEQPTQSRVIHTGRTMAGVYVDADTALKNATVWACVHYLTRAVAQLPWHVIREEDGGSVVQSKHPVDWLLWKRPCPDMGSFSWRGAMLGQALLRGNAYAEIEFDNRNMPYALWPIHPDRVKVGRDARGGVEYEVWNSGGSSLLPASSMFHLKGYGDGVVGLSVIDYAAQSIGWAQATEVFGATSFGEGMNPTSVVEIPQGLSPEALDELRAEFDALYKGPRGKRTAFIDAGMKFNSLTSKLTDAQFIETRQHQVEEICRWFGVPPHKVMHLLRATFSNIEHQAIEVVVDCVTPWVKLFEEEADYKLFGNNRQGFYNKMNLAALLRGDNASRLSMYKGLFELGVPINRILALEDMNGIGPDGDVSFVSNNVQTLKNAIMAPVKAAPADASGMDAPPPKPNGAMNGHHLVS